MRLLLSNDDGIEAEGLAVLERIARTMTDDVWIAAPLHERSGVAHSITLHDPLRVRMLGPQRYSVNGTPSDSVLLAIMEILEGRRPDLVLTGINAGRNVAEDVTYSGTIGAAMEATLIGVRAIALSNAHHPPPDAPYDWSAPLAFAPEIIRRLMALDWPVGTLMSVNFPGIPVAQVAGVRVCPQGARVIDQEKLHRAHDPRGRPYYWIGGPGASDRDPRADVDFKLLERGFITITPIRMDMTDTSMLGRLSEAFAGALPRKVS